MRDIDSLDYECIKIIVTHRLKTVKNCDEIYVLNNGLIIDHGKFDDLKNREFVVSVSNEKKVFISLTADNIHHGHINLINEEKYGNVVIGLLTDKAVATHKKLPILNYEQRKLIIKNISGVSEVIPQPEWDDSLIIDKVKPDIVIHGDDWVTGKQATLRKNVINILKKYGGKLIEVPYTKGISSEAISNKSKKVGISPDQRIKTLRRSIQNKDITRIIETHSPISALIAENAIVNINGKDKYFDGFWSSSLTDASLMGKPDIEVVDISKRLENINNIFEVTSKPLIMDIDTGGKTEHLNLNIKTIERLGISAVIMEDKTGLKNSLLTDTSSQSQESIGAFSEKLELQNESTKFRFYGYSENRKFYFRKRN